MKIQKKLLSILLVLTLSLNIFTGCGQTDSDDGNSTNNADDTDTVSKYVDDNDSAIDEAADNDSGTNTTSDGDTENSTDDVNAGNSTDYTTAAEPDSAIYINGRSLNLEEEGTIDLDLLSVEDGITITVESGDDEEVIINGETTNDEIFIDISAITRDDTIEIEITTADGPLTYTVNLMPSTFDDFTTEGESAAAGDYYLATYDEDVNYIFKLDSQGNLIFYKETDNNALDFRKQYNSSGEVRYTYLLYLENSFCGIAGINPGCIVIMDKSYEIIDEIYYLTSDGSERKIDPHGFIYIDDGHYILTSYDDVMIEDIPEDLNAVDNSAYLAVLYVEEVKDGEVLWEFCSSDYTQFLYATTEVNWDESATECYDYMHFNSMYIDNDDNLLVSCRNANSILKLSRESGELIWILGGTEDEFGLTDDQIFSKQHSIIVTDDGSYMIFNNANDEVSKGSADVSSVIRLKIDEETMNVTEYEKTDTEFYSNYMGSIRELDSENGIYLYAVGGNWTKKTPEWSMIEYNSSGEKLFTFRFNEGYRLLYCANKCE